MPASEFWDQEKKQVKGEELKSRFQEMATKLAANDVVEATRKADIPVTPDAYELKLAENIPLPAGTNYQFDEAGNKASFDAARAWAHSSGLTQTKFSEMMTLFASHEAQKDAALAERSRQEIAKAGINAPQRMDNVQKWVVGFAGEKDAAPINATMVTDAHLRFFEKLITHVTSQGTAPFSAQHRVAPEADKIPNYENLSFEQRRHAQELQRARRGA